MVKQVLTTIIAALAATTLMAQAPAFPGAEGHGRYVTGGRGGQIIHVTNLNDKGPGSLRTAVSGNVKKIVVFDVGGVIPLAGDLKIGENTTILGQTAPYPGITLRYYTVMPNKITSSASYECDADRRKMSTMGRMPYGTDISPA